MNPNKALWEKGDFTEIAAFMRESGESVVKSLEVRPPVRALDLGLETGLRRCRWHCWGRRSPGSTLRAIWWRQGSGGRRRRGSTGG